MKNRKGGYIIIDLENNDLTNSFTLEGVYERLEGNYGKAIQLTGITINSVEKADAFVIAKVDNSNFVIDVYGYTLAIDSDDLVTSAKQTYLMEDIVDANGNKRFVEGDITMETIDGVTSTYSKWSLSGSHLMIVLGFTYNQDIVSDADLAKLNLPSWIADKIYTLGEGTGVVTLTKEYVRRPQGTTPYAEYQIALLKLAADDIRVRTTEAQDAESSYCLARLQIDLLIDNE